MVLGQFILMVPCHVHEYFLIVEKSFLVSETNFYVKVILNN